MQRKRSFFPTDVSRKDSGATNAVHLACHSQGEVLRRTEMGEKCTAKIPKVCAGSRLRAALLKLSGRIFRSSNIDVETASTQARGKHAKSNIPTILITAEKRLVHRIKKFKVIA